MKHRIAVPSTLAAAVALSLWGLAPDSPTRQPDPTPLTPSTNSHVHFDASRTTTTGPSALSDTPGLAAQARPTAYRPNELLVSTRPGTDIRAMALEVGAQLVRHSEQSGLAWLDLSHVADAGQAVERIRARSDVSSATPHGIVEGASDRRKLQWRHERMEMNGSPADDFSHLTVAVLDTGIAYESYVDEGIHYLRAKAFDASQFGPGWDFVDDDAHANDDHQHGTHIASVIGGSHAAGGGAPKVRLLPIKVLDSGNAGTEYALIEGIYWSIDHGADVINLSLSFPDGYVPSQALVRALDEAVAANIVVVGAAGNHGLNRVTWPAAHPDVLAVGASRMRSAPTGRMPSGYSARSAAIDVLAVGGTLAEDRNVDGLADGVLAETIAPTDPAQLGQWFMAGTSQAAAIASAAAVRLLDAGVPPNEVPHLMRQTASQTGRHESHWSDDRIREHQRGIGSGHLELGVALDSIDLAPGSSVGEAHVGLLPWLEEQDGEIAPRVEVSVVDGEGRPIPDVTVFLTLAQQDDLSIVRCRTDDVGTCSHAGVFRPDDQPLTFTYTADAVVLQDCCAVRPRPAIYGGPAAEAFISTLTQDPQTAGLPVAWYWPGSDVPDLGRVAESYSVVDVGGSGIASIPLGVALNRSAVSPGSAHQLVDGTPVTLGSLGGSGLMSIPLGFRAQRVVFVDGTQTPGAYGFHVSGVIEEALLLSKPQGRLEGSALDTFVANGGWSASGYGLASYASAVAPTLLAPASVEDHVGALLFSED